MNLISTTSAENTREIIFSDADITQIVDSNHSVIRMLEKKSIVSNSKITNIFCVCDYDLYIRMVGKNH